MGSVGTAGAQWPSEHPGSFALRALLGKGMWDLKVLGSMEEVGEQSEGYRDEGCSPCLSFMSLLLAGLRLISSPE